MGLSYQGCLNLNEWNHLFRPNSQSAQEGRLNCFDHWNKNNGGDAPTVTINTTRSNLDERVSSPIGTNVFDANGQKIQRMELSQQYNDGPENPMPDSAGKKIVLVIVLLVILGYGFKNL